VRTIRVDTSRGSFAAIRAVPDGAVRGAAVLVPGWTGSKEDFTTLLVPLVRQGYVALAYDQRGQFETPGRAGGYSLAELASDLLAVAATLPAPVHLVGHSFGGLVVQHAVLAERRVVTSVTLMCSGPSALPEDRHAMLRLLADGVRAYDMPTVYAAKIAHESDQPGYVAPPSDVADFLRRRFVGNDPESLRAMSLHLVEAPDAIDALAATRVPVLVTHGETDDGWPRDLQDSMAKRLGADPVVIPGCGHSPAVDAPQEMAQVLVDFFERNG